MASKVDFLVCGTQKGGTTALHNYLGQHQEIYLPEKKELHYFDDESIDWKNPNYENYHSHFCEENTAGKICGEVTPIYMYWNHSMERIWQYNKKIKIIIILRNPITRAYSHWNMEKQRNADSLCFIKALETEQERSRISLPLQHRVYSYIDRGFYSQQIRHILRFFPRDQLLVLRQDALIVEAKQILATIFKFLGVENQEIEIRNGIHALNYEEPMATGAKKLLLEIFYAEIKQLEFMLKWDCSAWLEEVQ